MASEWTWGQDIDDIHIYILAMNTMWTTLSGSATPTILVDKGQLLFVSVNKMNIYIVCMQVLWNYCGKLRLLTGRLGKGSIARNTSWPSKIHFLIYGMDGLWTVIASTQSSPLCNESTLTDNNGAAVRSLLNKLSGLGRCNPPIPILLLYAVPKKWIYYKGKSGWRVFPHSLLRWT